MEIHVVLQGFQRNDTYTITCDWSNIGSAVRRVVSTFFVLPYINLVYIFMMGRDKLYPVVQFKKFTYLNYFIMEKRKIFRGEPNYFNEVFK